MLFDYIHVSLNEPCLLCLIIVLNPRTYKKEEGGRPARFFYCNLENDLGDKITSCSFIHQSQRLIANYMHMSMIFDIAMAKA